MLEQFEKIGKDALADLKKITDNTALEDFRIKYLGRKGQITQMLSKIGQFPVDQRPVAGQLANKIRKQVAESFDQLKKSLSNTRQEKTKEFIDVTLPGKPVNWPNGLRRGLRP
jgi:phenylalanyl-tRNA synthetase alpha chain